MRPVAAVSFAQRLVLVVGLAAALGMVARYVTTLGAGTAANFGWFGYAPLAERSPLNGGGLPGWARLLIWLGFIAVWVAFSLRLLRSRPGRN